MVNTIQKKIILETIKSIEGPFIPDELYLIMKEKGYRISRCTFYIDFNTMYANGTIERLPKLSTTEPVKYRLSHAIN